MGISKKLTASLTPKLAGAALSTAAPGVTGGVVREALDRAIRGIGPLPPAAFTAWKVKREAGGDVKQAVHDIIERHVRYAGGQGFVTNLGGIVTATATIPANISGLALVQARMIACIADLHGYDIHDPRVRSAILAALLGEDQVRSLVKARKLPGTPIELATGEPLPAKLETEIASRVANDLITRVTGKKVVGTVARKVPIAGGMVGLCADGYATWKLGRYADSEFRPRTKR